MAATSGRGPATTAILSLLRATVALTTYVGQRVYPDSNGKDAPARPSYPLVEVETGTEGPFNTMGSGVSALKWGSVIRVPIRVTTNDVSDAVGNAICSVIRGALDGQTPAVNGFASATIEFAHADPPLIATKDGCGTVREFVSEYLVTVHQ